MGSSSILNIAPGANLKLGEACYIGRQCEIAPGGRITIGRSTSIQDRAVILGDVAIGAYCTLAYNVYMSSGNHVIDWRPALPLKVQDIRAPANSSPVTLEEDCWLGNNVFVKAGIRIGRGAVVGANSVVTRDVPPYAIVAGSPARIIRSRLIYAPPKEICFDEIEKLPYFHAGFHLLDAELAESRSTGGLLAENSFSVVLDVSECSILGIEIRADSTADAEIEYAGQRHRLKKVFEPYEFKLASITGPHEFKVVGRTANIRISRVWAK